MNLKLLLPPGIFLDHPDVARIVAETDTGSFALLPHRLDCVAALVPGIFSYWSGALDPIYLAIDRGILVKCGALVLVSVRRAIGGASLSDLHAAVEREFKTVRNDDRVTRQAEAKLDAGLIARMYALQHAS